MSFCGFGILALRWLGYRITRYHKHRKTMQDDAKRCKTLAICCRQIVWEPEELPSFDVFMNQVGTVPFHIFIFTMGTDTHGHTDSPRLAVLAVLATRIVDTLTGIKEPCKSLYFVPLYQIEIEISWSLDGIGCALVWLCLIDCLIDSDLIQVLLANLALVIAQSRPEL